MLEPSADVVQAIRNDAVSDLEGFSDYNAVVSFPSDVEPQILAQKPTLVCVAACYGSLQCFTYLTESRCDLTKTDALRTPLDCFAAVSGCKEVVRRALALPSERLRDGIKNALHFAAEYGQVKIVKMLLKMGVYDVNSQDQSGMTALHLAVEHNRVDVVEFLLGVSDVRVEIKDNSGCTVLHTIARRTELQDLITKFITHEKLDPCELDENNWSCLHYAANVGNEPFVAHMQDREYLFELDKDTMPLHLAAKHGFSKVLESLLHMRGCDVNESDATSVSFVFTKLLCTMPVNLEIQKLFRFCFEKRT